MKTCRQCGFENEEGATFCGNCGEFLAWEQTPGDAQQQTSASTLTTNSTKQAVVASDLLQQARPSTLQPDEKQPSAGNKSATTAVKARTVDVGVTASPEEVFVEPGAEASCEVRVLNSGSIVDRVQLKVTGAGASWASFEPETLNVYPGATGTAKLTFRPPRTAQTTAGVVPFEVTGISQEDPTVTDRDGVNVTVAAFHELAAQLHPHKSQGRRSARHELTLANRGNANISVALAGSDENEALSLGLLPPGTTRSAWKRLVAWMLGRSATPPQASISMEAGEAVNVGLSVVARRLILSGTPLDRPFKVGGSSEGNQTVSLDGTMVQAAVLPSLIPRLLMAVLPLLAGLLIFLALTTTVPNVVGQGDTVALAHLQKVGLKPTRLEEKSDNVPVGQVTRTDPGPGSLRRNHTGVTFWVSAGPAQVAVPALANLDAATAKLQLVQAHLVEQDVNEANDTIAAGRVVDTAPAANTLVNRGTTVTVHVSLGASPVAVPEVAGSTQASAATKLRTAGFQVAPLQEPSASVRSGNVIRTDPPGGTLAPKASPVNLFVSTGPAPGGAPAPGGGAPAPGGGAPAPGGGAPAPGGGA
ncbi:MAG: hypothetical protein QOD01_2498, partial [Actinomycetota bacterium]|nr:hypothetical protein [Actinomycetota bacterium]